MTKISVWLIVPFPTERIILKQQHIKILEQITMQKDTDGYYSNYPWFVIINLPDIIEREPVDKYVSISSNMYNISSYSFLLTSIILSVYVPYLALSITF